MSARSRRIIVAGGIAALLVSSWHALAGAANKDLVIVHSERWIDTLKGVVKNVSADRAEDVVIVVRFYGDPTAQSPGQRPRKSPRRQELGQQTARVAALEPGQEAPFEVEIVEKHRGATSYRFEPHAIWRKAKDDRSRRR
jgi:hypothetical protein